jgi:lantibiotic modifying enzyme
MRYQRLLASFDEAVARETVQNAARLRASDQVSVGDFDVISGLSGVGAYLVCRRDEPAIGVALANAVDALAYVVTRDRTPPAWYTPAHLLYDDATREMYPHGNLNCGLAHGVPGILAFLSLVRLTGGSSPTLDEAIETIADWLLVNRLDDDWGVNWPAAVPLEAMRLTNGDVTLRPADPATAPGGPGRAAWCYGAPGIARALWLAGRAMDRTDYRTVAILAMEAVFRRPIPTRMIDSPTFCHGVAGLLAITLRFAADTGDAQFARAAEELTQQILGRFQRESLLGFRNLEYRGNETDQPGLLDGAAGVAIVLLAAATGVEPTWDRAFLLS